jgi:hypothetical protein
LVVLLIRTILSEHKVDMKRRKLKRIILIVLAALVVGFGLMVYNIMGPLSSFFWNLPYMGGFFGSKSYLVLLQNNYELRPGGGFITAYAEVKASFGSVSYQVHDVYDLPDPLARVTAPYPFEFLIGQHDPFYAGFTFRDANFSPDFQESAEEVLSFYNRANPDADIDAVLTVDFHVFEGLLDLYDGVEVNGVNYTSENFFYLTQVVSKDIDTHDVGALVSRKNVLTPLAQETFRQVKGRASRYGDLIQLMKDELDSKHLQVYMVKSDRLQNKLRRFGWTGELNPSVPLGGTSPLAGENTKSDFVHANLANIGGRKGDRYLQKEYDYVLTMPQNHSLSSGSGQADLHQTDLHPRAKFTARFTHQGDYNIQSDIYQGYFRLYVPDGSILLSPSPSGLELTEQGRGLGLTYFADMFRLKPEEQIEIVYEYLLPVGVTAENYELYIPKQAGTDRDSFHVTVRFQNDSLVRNVSETKPKFPISNFQFLRFTDFDIRENVVSWSGIQNSDLLFATELLPDTTPPIVLWQEFADSSLDLINVRFHEAIDEKHLDTSSVVIEDLDTAHPHHDEIVIERVWFDENGRDMWVRVNGIIKAPLEKYKMTLYGIRDLAGNIIDPNPKEFTLVQR